MGIAKKSKSFDEVLFVVGNEDEFIGCKRSLDTSVVWDNDSNGSNSIDDDGGGADGVAVGQMEGCVLNKDFSVFFVG